MLTTLFSFITNALVRRRIDQSLGRARVVGASGHVLIVGLGAVGMRVLEGLIARGEQVVVIERDESHPYLNQARTLGVRVVVGDATLQTTLDLANLRTASAVAIPPSDDLANIETGLAVRDGLRERWFDVPVVLRVFDRSLGQRVSAVSTSTTRGPPPRSPHRGSSASRSGWMFSRPSSSITSRSYWRA